MSGCTCQSIVDVDVEIERRLATLFHLRAGIKKLQGEIDALISQIETETPIDIAEPQPIEPGISVTPVGIAADAHAHVDPAIQSEASSSTLSCVDDLELGDDSVGLIETEATTVDDHTADLNVSPQDNDDLVLPATHAPPDALTLIKGITDAIENVLFNLGIKSFQDIARLTAEDVEQIQKAIGSQGNVSKQNWIEQAAILASGQTTHFVRMTEQASSSTADGEIDAIDAAEAHDTDALVAQHPTASVVALEAARLQATRRQVAAAVKEASHIGRNAAIAASVFGLMFYIQMAGPLQPPRVLSPELRQIASCGKEILGGNVTCAVAIRSTQD